MAMPMSQPGAALGSLRIVWNVAFRPGEIAEFIQVAVDVSGTLAVQGIELNVQFADSFEMLDRVLNQQAKPDLVITNFPPFNARFAEAGLIMSGGPHFKYTHSLEDLRRVRDRLGDVPILVVTGAPILGGVSDAVIVAAGATDVLRTEDIDVFPWEISRPQLVARLEDYILTHQGSTAMK
jgi:hypothetical protein